MSQDRPALDNILATVRQFLEAGSAAPEGTSRYEMQLAAYLLAIAEREARLAPALDAAERARLAAFLGVDGSVTDLNRRLAADIRAGRLDDRWPQTSDLVRAHVIDKVTVVRPERLEPDHRP